jgi:hypothetical protein
MAKPILEFQKHFHYIKANAVKGMASLKGVLDRIITELFAVNKCFKTY